MSFFRKTAAVILGTTEAKLVKAERDIAYAIDKMSNPEMANNVEQVMLVAYQDSMKEIAYQLGRASKHIGLSDADSQLVLDSDFTGKFASKFALDLFVRGFHIGYGGTTGQEDQRYLDESNLIAKEMAETIQKEARQRFGKEDIVRVYVHASRIAFEEGIKQGISFAKK